VNLMTNRQEKEAEYIQSLSVAQLKALEANVKWVQFDLSEEPVVTKMTSSQYNDYILSLNLDELRALMYNWTPVGIEIIEDEVEYKKYLDEKLDFTHQDLQNHALAEPQALYSIDLKMQKTGLTKTQIKVIENDKTQATLSEIIQYCKGLDIPYATFLPELF
jgi:hypothetical protein